MPARSLPAPGSVIATAMMVSPLVIPGNQRFFCSSLVRSLKYGPTTSLCRLSAGAGTPALAISSSMIALNLKSSVPPPPNSSGMLNPMSPCLPAATYADRSTMRSASHFSALGTSSLSM
jgi:hypothetical protein